MKNYFLTLLFSCISFFAVAEKKWNIRPFERKAFIENKGQFNAELPKQYQNFEFAIDNNARILFSKTGLTYVVKKSTRKKLGVLSIFMSEEKREDKEHDFKIENQYIEANWIGANTNCVIETHSQKEATYNYMFTSSSNAPYTDACKGYDKIVYKNIYEGIDIEYFFTEKEGFKYNIKARTGADLSQIKLQYNSNASISLNSQGDVVIKTIKGDITEKAPVSFLSESNQPIQSNYSLQKNTLVFHVNNPTKQAITIDPYVIVPTGASPVFDNGVDNAGNIYIYGGGGNYVVEKYTSAGVLIYSFTPGVVDRMYYGDLLVDGSGDFYICEGFRQSGARTHKFTTASNFLWTSTTPGNDFREHWRLGLDCKTGRIIVIGGGTQYTMSIAEISVATGVLTNIKGLNNNDLLGLVVDGNGKSCIISVNDDIIFTDAANNNVGSVNSGYGYVYSMSVSNPSGIGYNCMALGGSNFLFTSDGATLKKWDRTTSSLVGSVAIPGGNSKTSSGIYVDGCNNVFVGSNNGVYRFDNNLVQQEFLATSDAVFDVAFAPNGDVIASGTGFTTNLTFNVPPCIFKSTPVVVNACSSSPTGSIKLNVTGGSPTYNYSWFHDGLPIAANTDSIGNLAVGVYKCIYTDSPCTNPRIDSVTLNVLAVTSPTVNFNFNPVCIGSPVNFTNTSVPTASMSNITWRWNFENDNINDNTTQSPSMLYPTINSYSIKLHADLFGCKDSIIKIVNVYSKPTPAFMSDSVCFSFASQLQDASNGNGHPLTNFQWDVLNNDDIADLSGGDSPSYIFSMPGNNVVNYTVSTTPAAGLTCSSDTTQNVWVYGTPEPAFTFVNYCINSQPNTFDPSGSIIAIGTITNYAWNFGDTQTSNLITNAPTNHSYANVGLYPVQLTLTSNKGCVASVTHMVEVYQKPIMSISASSLICLGYATTFTANSAPNSGNIVLWQWDTNNMLSSIETTGQSSSFVFATEGLQTLQLIATTNNGCKDTIAQQTYVNYLPQPNFTVDKPMGCPLPHCVTFTDNSVVTGPAIINQWSWNFGNGTTIISATSANQNTCYTNTSSNQLALYTVTLATKTDSGCVFTRIETDMVSVYPKPIANYTITPDWGNVIIPQVHFTNQSIDYTKWYWNFGETPLIDSLNKNPTHAYNTIDSREYQSQLIVVNQYGCSDTTMLLVDIAPDFVFYIPNAFTPNSDGVNDGFTGTGVGIEKYEMWIYNRWGTMIYYTDDINKPWTGKIQGKSEEAQQDIYTWKVELKDVFSKKHNYVGHVTLLK